MSKVFIEILKYLLYLSALYWVLLYAAICSFECNLHTLLHQHRVVLLNRQNCFFFFLPFLVCILWITREWLCHLACCWETKPKDLCIESANSDFVPLCSLWRWVAGIIQLGVYWRPVEFAMQRYSCALESDELHGPISNTSSVCLHWDLKFSTVKSSWGLFQVKFNNPL